MKVESKKCVHFVKLSHMMLKFAGHFNCQLILFTASANTVLIIPVVFHFQVPYISGKQYQFCYQLINP